MRANGAFERFLKESNSFLLDIVWAVSEIRVEV